jgi:hypothetical protein
MHDVALYDPIQVSYQSAFRRLLDGAQGDVVMLHLWGNFRKSFVEIFGQNNFRGSILPVEDSEVWP